MFQYVELWGRDRRENRDIVEKEIMNSALRSSAEPPRGQIWADKYAFS